MSDAMSEAASGAMTTASREGMAEARIANVSGVLLVLGRGTPAETGGHEAHVSRQSEAMASIFEETLVARDDGADDPLGLFVSEEAVERKIVEGLVAVLGEATTDRVLVVTDEAEALGVDVWLALTAWPEHVAVVVQLDEKPLAAIYQRDRMAAAARTVLGMAAPSRSLLHESVDASLVSLEELGLSDLREGLAEAGHGEAAARGGR